MYNVSHPTETYSDARAKEAKAATLTDISSSSDSNVPVPKQKELGPRQINLPARYRDGENQPAKKKRVVNLPAPNPEGESDSDESTPGYLEGTQEVARFVAPPVPVGLSQNHSSGYENQPMTSTPVIQQTWCGFSSSQQSAYQSMSQQSYTPPIMYEAAGSASISSQQPQSEVISVQHLQNAEVPGGVRCTNGQEG